jgi:hypothetical protein
MTTPGAGPAERPPADQLLRTRHRLWATVAIAASTIAVLLSALVVVVLKGDDESASPGGQPSGPTTTQPTSPTPSPTQSTPKQTPTPTPTQTPAVTFKYQPLWPFTSTADAAAWQAAYRSGGHQPWHLDPSQTALTFTRGYLGFTDIDRVISRSVRGSEAWIAVGHHDPNGDHGVAAVLHLARIGAGQDAPWEVVGSRDTTLTLDRPAYGAKVTSPITVGGRITGVDESILVEVRQPSSERPLGSAPGVPAGGEHQPWSTRVSFRGATDPALTIVASTGGHLLGVERFAITGVRY